MSAFGTKISKLSQIQKQGAAATLPGERIEEIDPELINCQKQLRTEENPGFAIESLAELANDMARDGQHEPAVVRKNPSNPGRYLMVAGERRWRACKLIGLKLKAVVREMTDEQARRTQRAENIQRENLTQLEVADALRNDKERLGTLERVAGEWNKSLNWVAERIKFLEAVEAAGQASTAVTKGLTADITVVNDLHRLEKIDPAAAQTVVEQAKSDPDINMRKTVREKLQHTKHNERQLRNENSRMREKSDPEEQQAPPLLQYNELHPDAALLIVEAAQQSRALCDQINSLSMLLQQRKDVRDLLGDALKGMAHAQAELFITRRMLDTLANQK